MNHDGYADMWAAAIEYAFRAACEPIAPAKNNVSNGGCAPSEAANEWRFLTDEKGGWAESRAIICWMNGVDPDVVRNEALRRGISRGAQYGLMRNKERAALLNKRPGRDQRILADYAAGRPQEDIAKEHGISVGRVIQIAQENHVKRPKSNTWPGRHKKVKSPEELARNERIVKAWADGISLEQIADDERMKTASVKSIARRAGVKRPDWFAGAHALKNSAAIAAKNAERNAEILHRRAMGQGNKEIADAMGLRPNVVKHVKAGSAVDARGGSRAAGGVGVSFHAQNMTENGR